MFIDIGNNTYIMDNLNFIVERHTGPETIPDEVFERYDVDKKNANIIYNNYRLYNRMLQYVRKGKENKEDVKRKSKLTYYCEICDKDVRCMIKYHHIRTKKHIILQAEVEKKMEELAKEQKEQKE